MDKDTGHLIWSLTQCESMKDVGDCLHWYCRRNGIKADFMYQIREELDKRGISGGLIQMQHLEKLIPAQSPNLAG